MSKCVNSVPICMLDWLSSRSHPVSSVYCVS